MVTKRKRATKKPAPQKKATSRNAGMPSLDWTGDIFQVGFIENFETEAERTAYARGFDRGSEIYGGDESGTVTPEAFETGRAMTARIRSSGKRSARASNSWMKRISAHERDRTREALR